MCVYNGSGPYVETGSKRDKIYELVEDEDIDNRGHRAHGRGVGDKGAEQSLYGKVQDLLVRVSAPAGVHAGDLRLLGRDHSLQVEHRLDLRVGPQSHPDHPQYSHQVVQPSHQRHPLVVRWHPAGIRPKLPLSLRSRHDPYYVIAPHSPEPLLVTIHQSDSFRQRPTCSSSRR